MSTFATAYAMKERMKRSMLRHPRVQGIGVGYHDPKRPEKGAAVIIYVDALSPVLSKNPSVFSIRQKGKAVPVRLVRTGRIRFNADFGTRIRPVQAGYSIGTSDSSGTLGLVVSSIHAKKRYMFSNNHVLTNPVNSKRRVGTVQPGSSGNGRTAKDQVGRLSRFVRLNRKGTNFMDAALSVPLRRVTLNPRYPAVGIIPGHVTSYRVGERLKKVGQTTGLTYGRVDSVNADIKVAYDNLGLLTFRDQTVIIGSKPVSLPGDSGSVWLRRRDRFAAAVNFAGNGNGKTSIAFPVDWVMRKFRTRTATPTGAGRIRTIPKAKGNRSYARHLTAKELTSIKVITV